MSLAFEIELRASRTVRALILACHLAAAAGLGLAAAFLDRRGLAAFSALLLAAGIAFLAAAALRATRTARGRLRVDASGVAHWRAGEAGGQAGCGRGNEVKIEIARWHCGSHMAWLRASEPLAPARRRALPGARDLFVGRDACSREAWRALRSWLTWLGRAGGR